HARGLAGDFIVEKRRGEATGTRGAAGFWVEARSGNCLGGLRQRRVAGSGRVGRGRGRWRDSRVAKSWRSGLGGRDEESAPRRSETEGTAHAGSGRFEERWEPGSGGNPCRRRDAGAAKCGRKPEPLDAH